MFVKILRGLLEASVWTNRSQKSCLRKRELSGRNPLRRVQGKGIQNILGDREHFWTFSDPQKQAAIFCIPDGNAGDELLAGTRFRCVFPRAPPQRKRCSGGGRVQKSPAFRPKPRRKPKLWPWTKHQQAPGQRPRGQDAQVSRLSQANHLHCGEAKTSLPACDPGSVFHDVEVQREQTAIAQSIRAYAEKFQALCRQAIDRIAGSKLAEKSAGPVRA